MVIQFIKINSEPKSVMVGGLFRSASLRPSLTGDAVTFLCSGASGDTFVITITAEELAEIALKSNDVLLTEVQKCA